MKPWMLAMLGAARVQVTPPPFTANATWVAPVTTSRIDTLVGKGGAGAPGGWEDGYETLATVFIEHSDGSTEQFSPTSQGFSAGAVPDGYCDPSVPHGPGETSTTCYNFVYAEVEYPPTTGASTTGFGKTFPGGTGGAATPVTYPNVAVTPGASYSLVVPAGGSITITYWQ